MNSTRHGHKHVVRLVITLTMWSVRAYRAVATRRSMPHMFGAMANAEYSFTTTNKLQPYAFGGPGLFYSKVSSDYNGVFDTNAYDSSRGSASVVASTSRPSSRSRFGS